MTYGYENLKLEKGMYAQSGKSFSRVLESLDPSENYRGTALEGLDAFQRQLKRFDIHVKGAGSDMVEKFFHTTDSAVLFPEFVSRVVRQGMESDILPEITATTTNFDGMDYRTIASVPTDDDKALRRVEEGAVLPPPAIRTQENLVKLHKRGRMLVASYEAIRFQRLDLFSVTLRQIGAYIARMHLDDAVQVLMNGDGNNNAATSYTIGDGGIGGTKGTLSYDALLGFWSQFDPYTMNTMLMTFSFQPVKWNLFCSRPKTTANTMNMMDTIPAAPLVWAASASAPSAPKALKVPATMSAKAAMTMPQNSQQNSRNSLRPVLPMYFSISMPMLLPSFLTEAYRAPKSVTAPKKMPPSRTHSRTGSQPKAAA